MSQTLQWQGGGWSDIGHSAQTPFNIANQTGPGPGQPVVGAPRMQPDAYMQPAAGAVGYTNRDAGPGSVNVVPYSGEGNFGAPTRTAYELFAGEGGYTYRIYADGRIEVSRTGAFPGKVITAQSDPVPYRAIMAEFQASSARTGRRINPAVLVAMLRSLATAAAAMRPADMSVVTPSAVAEAAPLQVPVSVSAPASAGGIPWWAKLLGTAAIGGIGFWAWRRSRAKKS